MVRAPVKSVDAVGLKVLSKQEDVANARLHFANGCIANVTASRVSQTPKRCMHIWGPEGYARLDFQKRHLTLVQPSEELRLKAQKLDAPEMARLKDELYSRHFQVSQIDRNEGDQLTRELKHFVNCVRTGATPRVCATDGVEAIALATRILASMATHRWEGHEHGPMGPMELPAACGSMFTPAKSEEA